jgi:hypothetical protein
MYDTKDAKCNVLVQGLLFKTIIKGVFGVFVSSMLFQFGLFYSAQKGLSANLHKRVNILYKLLESTRTLQTTVLACSLVFSWLLATPAWSCFIFLSLVCLALAPFPLGMVNHKLVCCTVRGAKKKIGFSILSPNSKNGAN